MQTWATWTPGLRERLLPRQNVSTVTAPEYKVDTLYSFTKGAPVPSVHAFTGSTEALYQQATVLRTHSSLLRSWLLVVSKIMIVE